MGLAGPVTGDADGNEDDGVAGAWEGGDASAAGLSRPRLKYLSIFRCFLWEFAFFFPLFSFFFQFSASSLYAWVLLLY